MKYWFTRFYEFNNFLQTTYKIFFHEFCRHCNVINSTAFSIYWGFADSQKQQQCKLFHL